MVRLDLGMGRIKHNYHALCRQNIVWLLFVQLKVKDMDISPK